MSVEVPETFLELCKLTSRNCGVGGSGSSDVPTAVTSQTGELARIVAWVAEAWLKIQRKHQDWSFLRKSASWTTVSGTSKYALGTGAGTVGITKATFGRWLRKTFRNYNTSAGLSSEVTMAYLDYDIWRNAYLLGGTRDARSRPHDFAIGPDKAIHLGPVPAAGYTVTGDYFIMPVTLAANADEPDIPIPFRMLIVYQAMQTYGFYEGAPEVLAWGRDGYAPLMAELENDRLDEVTFAGSLA